MFVQYNPNPQKRSVDDCVVRAITKILDVDWDTAYLGVVMEGFATKNMPSVNTVWGSYLKRKGFTRHAIPNTCPDCYTVKDFCKDHPKGKYILGTGSHVIAAVDGNWFDNWDSGAEAVVMYFVEEG